MVAFGISLDARVTLTVITVGASVAVACLVKAFTVIEPGVYC